MVNGLSCTHNLECQELKEIKVIGSNSRDLNYSRKFSKTSLETLTKKYQEYHKKLIEKQEKTIKTRITRITTICKNKIVL